MRITAGSTKALHPPSSSKSARTNEIAAEPRRMRTSWSLNCSRMSCHIGVGGSSGIARRGCLLVAYSPDRLASYGRRGGERKRGFNIDVQFLPCFARWLATCASVSPVAGFTPRVSRTSLADFANAFSMIARSPSSVVCWCNLKTRCARRYQGQLKQANKAVYASESILRNGNKHSNLE